MSIHSSSVLCAAVLLAGTFSVTATAQPNWQAVPTYTTVDLRAGFTPDPWTINIEAGGNDRVSSRLGRDCAGFINNAAPDVDLNYDRGAGILSLYIHAQSSTDTTLVVLDPQGNWHCNDDAIGLNPMVVFQSPLSGNYNIWLGVLGAAGTAPATLLITELDPTGQGRQAGGGSRQQPNWQAQPTYGTVALRAGFTPDPWRQDLQAGGSDDIGQSVGGECIGFINASAPDVDLNYDRGTGRLTLHFHVASQADTTIAVLDPNGRWHCNDDAIGLDPVVSVANPPSGNYNIWVGVHGAARLAPAQLRITELNPRR